MLLILFLDFLLVATLVLVARRKGLENALPYLVFFLILLPEEARVSGFGLVDLHAQRIALIVVTCLFLTNKKMVNWRQVPLRRLMCLHFTWIAVSTVFSIVFTVSFKQMMAHVVEFYLLYYIMIKSITSEETIRKIFFATIVAMGVCCVFGFVEINAGWSVLSLFPEELQLTYGTGTTLYSSMWDRGVRARSTFPHPILFGGAIAMTIPLALYFATSRGQRNVHKIIVNTSLLLMSYSLYKSGSRGPWIAALVATAVLMVAASGRLKKRVLSFFALGIVILVIRPGVAESLWNVYRASLSSNSAMGASADYRPALFRTVARTFTENPVRAIVGYGMGSFREKGLIIELPGIETHRWYTCDSTWILIWYETGYVGLLISLTLLLKAAAGAWQSYRKLPSSDKHISLSLLASMSAFYIVMISVSVFAWGQNGYMLWVVIALSTAYTRIKQTERRAAILPVATVTPDFVIQEQCATTKPVFG